MVSFLKSNFAEVQGQKMFLDKKDVLGLSINGVYEPLETKLVRKEVKKSDVVLDIGANIGYYTLILAKLVGKKGRVFAFEPDPTNFALLKKNISINGYKNVILVPKAVAGKTRRGNTCDGRQRSDTDTKGSVYSYCCIIIGISALRGSYGNSACPGYVQVTVGNSGST